ncbi:TetR/AcrR family transcriptional regulator [Nocardioides insulae]|uniref:TetR/AcrR family transcriptional regulator n=1 Tax=Nocardioides insulae TaxID=394734 RepID=UPI00048CC513|nr:TetR/AcrR family transcriptional regulator [Nocardioides insulae]
MATSDPVERVRDAERTRRDLLEVATEVFAERGYAGARVDEIAERTRTTKRMIYYYFGGKEQLYLAVLESAYRRIREVEQRIEADDLEPLDAVRRIAELTFDHHHDNPAFIRLVSSENIQRGENLRRVESLRDLGAPATEMLDRTLARGRESGQIREDVDALDVHMLISAYCVFQVANRSTFDFLFDRDMTAPDVRTRHRRILGDVVVGWLATR